MKAVTIVSRRVALRLLTALLPLLATGISGGVEAQPPKTVGADGRLVQRTAYSHTVDGAVPRRAVVAARPRAEVGEASSSGAGSTEAPALATHVRIPSQA